MHLLGKSLSRARTLRDVVKAGTTVDDNFVDTCFEVGPAPCRSGHHIYRANGWIFDFFTSRILKEGGTPVTYVSWDDKDTGRMFYQAYGLTHADYDADGQDGVLQMRFSTWTYEVLDKALFEEISLKDRAGAQQAQAQAQVFGAFGGQPPAAAAAQLQGPADSFAIP